MILTLLMILDCAVPRCQFHNPLKLALCSSFQSRCTQSISIKSKFPIPILLQSLISPLSFYHAVKSATAVWVPDSGPAPLDPSSSHSEETALLVIRDSGNRFATHSSSRFIHSFSLLQQVKDIGFLLGYHSHREAPPPATREVEREKKEKNTSERDP